jgi:hypothetical protein
MVERRKHLRINKSLVSQIFADNISLFVITGDLSVNGLFLRSKRCLPANSFVTIEIVLPDNSVSSLRGIVRRTINNSAFSHNGMGIEIIGKDSNYIQFMKSILGETETNDEERPTSVSSETTLSSIQEEKEGLNKPKGEKRQSPRYILNDKEIAVMIGSSDEVKIVDISTGGISFKTEKRLHHDKQYVMQLNNRNRVLTLQGAVKWISLNEYKKLCSRSELIPTFHKELLPIYTVGMQFTNLQGHTSDEVMQFVDGLTKIDTVYHYNDYINLSDLILSEFVEPMEASRKTAYPKDKSSQYKRKKDTGEKRKSASYCGSKERAHLLKDPNKEIVLSVLENPKITEMEIEKFAKLHTIPEEAIKKIIQNKAWMNHYGIVLALVNNPKAPPFIATILAKKLKNKDLKKVERNREVSETVRGAARKLLSHNI